MKKLFTDGRRTDDGRRVIRIAHLVSLRLSGELKKTLVIGKYLHSSSQFVGKNWNGVLPRAHVLPVGTLSHKKKVLRTDRQMPDKKNYVVDFLMPESSEVLQIIIQELVINLNRKYLIIQQCM